MASSQERTTERDTDAEEEKEDDAHASLRAKMREILKCSRCTGSLEDPVSLPCGHSFCAKCMERFYVKNKGHRLACPSCKEAFRAVSPVFVEALKLITDLVSKNPITDDRGSGERRANKGGRENGESAERNREGTALCSRCFSNWNDSPDKQPIRAPGCRAASCLKVLRALARSDEEEGSGAEGARRDQKRVQYSGPFLREPPAPPQTPLSAQTFQYLEPSPFCSDDTFWIPDSFEEVLAHGSVPALFREEDWSTRGRISLQISPQDLRIPELVATPPREHEGARPTEREEEKKKGLSKRTRVSYCPEDQRCAHCCSYLRGLQPGGVNSRKQRCKFAPKRHAKARANFFS